jgi:hypothetical protein
LHFSVRRFFVIPLPLLLVTYLLSGLSLVLSIRCCGLKLQPP